MRGLAVTGQDATEQLRILLSDNSLVLTLALTRIPSNIPRHVAKTWRTCSIISFVRAGPVGREHIIVVRQRSRICKQHLHERVHRVLEQELRQLIDTLEEVVNVRMRVRSRQPGVALAE